MEQYLSRYIVYPLGEYHTSHFSYVEALEAYERMIVAGRRNVLLFMWSPHYADIAETWPELKSGICPHPKRGFMAVIKSFNLDARKEQNDK